MSSEIREASANFIAHDHGHAQNRFAVIPTYIRLGADSEYTGRGVTLAFLDSGFYPHPDLTEPINRIIAYHDITGEEATLDADQVSQSWHWHGTMTSVVAAGNGQLSDGVYQGLARGARVVLVKVSAGGVITEENIARGIEWVIENRERWQIGVLNISLGGDKDIPCRENTVDLAAEKAIRHGITVIAAAGNNGLAERHTSVPPANSPSVITVGGYDDGNRLDDRDYDLYSSNYGATADGTVKPEIIAPAMWVAAPILPNTNQYQLAENLSRLFSAPDYLLPRLVREMRREMELLPAALLSEQPEVIRLMVETLLRENKVVAAHYQHADGTSFAAPLVSSIVAQMLEANPALTPAAIKHILISTAGRIGNAPAIRQGYGVVNARRAVEAAQSERHSLSEASYGLPRTADGKIRFLYHDDMAEAVALVGDFNNWSSTHAPLMRGVDGVWRVEIEPPPTGIYRYKFIINGVRWTDDPNHNLKDLDGYGGFNSLLKVI